MNIGIPETDGIFLSEPDEGDITSYVLHLADGKVAKNTGVPFPYHAGSAEYFIENAIFENTAAQLRTNEFLPKPLIFSIRDNLGFAIGVISAKNERRWKANIGYWLGEPYWGKGIMSKVVASFCRYLFTEEGFEFVRLGAGTTEDNIASRRVLEKNGFFNEGLRRKLYKRDGELINGVMYGLLKEDWASINLGVLRTDHQ